jgi:hypothetical protein
MGEIYQSDGGGSVNDAYLEYLRQASPGARLQHLMAGYWTTQAIAVAAELGIADLLVEGPRASEELAAATGTHPAALYRLLRALAGLGLFTEGEPHAFAVTYLGALFQSDHPQSLRRSAMYAGGEETWQSARHLRYSIETGQSAFEHVFQMSVWEYRAQHPEASASFTANMTGVVAQVADAVVAAYDFTSFGTVVDLGGGDGSLLASILRATPGLRGILLEEAPVAERASRSLETAGLQDRCAVISGDFFATVPAGGDAYVLSRVIQSFDDTRSIALLRSCRQVIGSHGRLLVIEELIPPGDAPSYSKLHDLTMLANAGGRQRTEAEYGALYEAAGFTAQVIPTQSRIGIIEGIPS